jgi:hypothetical protein
MLQRVDADIMFLDPNDVSSGSAALIEHGFDVEVLDDWIDDYGPAAFGSELASPPTSLRVVSSTGCRTSSGHLTAMFRKLISRPRRQLQRGGIRGRIPYSEDQRSSLAS